MATATAPAPTVTKPGATPTSATAVKKPPLVDALDRLTTTRRTDAESSLKVWRALAAKLADDKPLADAEVMALSEAMRVLGLTADDFAADVKGIIKHRQQKAAHAAAKKLVDEYDPQQKAWTEEEQRLKKRAQDIAALRARLMSEMQMMSAHDNEVRALVSAHARVLTDLETAVAKSLAGPAGAYVPKMISSRDEYVKNQDRAGQFVGQLG